MSRGEVGNCSGLGGRAETDDDASGAVGRSNVPVRRRLCARLRAQRDREPARKTHTPRSHRHWLKSLSNAAQFRSLSALGIHASKFVDGAKKFLVAPRRTSRTTWKVAHVARGDQRIAAARG